MGIESDKSSTALRSSLGAVGDAFPCPAPAVLDAPDPRDQEVLRLLRLAQEIGLGASQIVSTRGILQFVLERLAAFTLWPIGHVWLPDPPGEQLRPTDLWVLGDCESAAHFRDATQNDGLARRNGLAVCAARERRAVWWTSLPNRSEFARREAAAAAGIRTGFAFPVFGRQGLVAVFEFFATEDTVPTEAFLEVLAQIATLVGHVFERRSVESRLAWSETLLRRMTDASRLGFCVVNDQNGKVLYLNRCFREIWQLPAEGVLAAPRSLSIQTVMDHCRSLAARPEDADRLFAPGEAEAFAEGEVTLRDGRVVRSFATRIESDGDSPLGRMHLHEDITHQRRGETKFRDLLESAPDAMVIVGQDGRIALVNAEMERLFGYGRQEILGQPVETLVPMEERASHLRNRAHFLRDPHTRAMGANRNIFALRRDGSTFPAEISLSPLTTEEGVVVTATIRDITERKRLERQLSEAVCREQQALGQELHDGLGGSLTGLALMSKSLEEKLASAGSPLATKAREITDCARMALEATRDLAKGLVPVEVEARGLMAALDDLATSASSRTGIACTFSSSVPVPVLDRVMATHLFRIAQEALTNAVRHGRARHVWIRLRSDAEQLTLEVEDDGHGFSTRQREHGLGLNTMRHRAGVIGGTLQVQSRSGKGTTISCVVKGWSGNAERDEY